MGFTEGPNLNALLARANSLGLVHTEYEWDDTENRMLERRTQDVEPALELNKQRQQDGAWWSQDKDLLLVADIPFAIAEQWMREHGITPREFMQLDPGKGWLKRKLEDPENRFLRVYPGKI